LQFSPYKRNSRLLAVFVSLLVLAESCAVRSLYIPVSQNVPLFDNERSIQGNVYLGLNHIELQLAHNPINHVAFSSNLNFGGGISIYDFAAGWYNYNSSGSLRYELFAGYGYNSNIVFPASYSNIFTRQRIDYEVNSLYNKYYFQPAAGYFGHLNIYRLHYSFTLSARLSYLHFRRFLYRELDNDHTIDPDNPVYQFSRSYRNKGLLLLEPCITNKVGRGPVSGILQVQGMIPYSEAIDVSNTSFSPGILLSIGIEYTLGLKSKK